jgi:hypothetical protein
VGVPGSEVPPLLGSELDARVDHPDRIHHQRWLDQKQDVTEAGGGAGRQTAWVSPDARSRRFWAASLMRVLMTQIGFTTSVVRIPAIAAANIWGTARG